MTSGSGHMSLHFGGSRAGGLEEPLLHDLERASSLGTIDAGNDEERAILERRMQDPGWRLDRGAGYYALERQRNKRAFLVKTGRHAGRSNVKVTGLNRLALLRHKFRRNFFNSAVNAPLTTILATLALMYFCSLMFWSLAYYSIWRYNDTCFTGFNGLISAFLFAVETQQTIGYGTRAPGNCWMTFATVAVHSLVAVVLDSMILGITFARISHPKNRGRTILISDCACIARRDGDLKFMFRIADIAPRQVVNPVVRTFLFTWGPNRSGRYTAEGEHLPVTIQEMSLTRQDPTLLLPITLEHIIDDRSPLAGHTQKTLENLCAEVVVVMHATTELGDTFSVRQSYLPQEIHWGHAFADIIHPAPEGDSQHSVDISKFHDVEPQPGLDLVQPHRLASKVVAAGDRGALPAPLLGTNTLVLSDTGVIGARDGKVLLMFRVGDVYPGGQVLDIQVSAFLYRWQPTSTPEGEVIPYTVCELSITPGKPCLRLPVIVCHELTDPTSPLQAWVSAAAKRADSDAEVLVSVRGQCAHTGLPITRQRVYPVLAGIKWGALFVPMITGPMPGVSTLRSRHATGHVDWPAFHNTAPAQMEAGPGLSRAASAGSLHLPTGSPASGTLAGPAAMTAPPGLAQPVQPPSSASTQAVEPAVMVQRFAPPGIAPAHEPTEVAPHSLDSWKSGQEGALSSALPGTTPFPTAMFMMNTSQRRRGGARAQQHRRNNEAGRLRMHSHGMGQVTAHHHHPVEPEPALASSQQVVGGSSGRNTGQEQGGSPVHKRATIGGLSGAMAAAAAAAIQLQGSSGGNTPAGSSPRSGSSTHHSGLPPLAPPAIAHLAYPGLRQPYAAIPGRSGENTLSHHSSSRSGNCTGNEAFSPDDWRVTRSLFVAMEEMAKLAAEQQQGSGQQ